MNAFGLSLDRRTLRHLATSFAAPSLMTQSRTPVAVGSPVKFALAVLAACSAASAAACARPIGNPLARSTPTADFAPVYTHGDTVEMFAPGVISAGDVFGASFTSDGATVYFTQATNDRTRMQIMRSRWGGASVPGGWTTPVRASFSTGTQQMDASIAPGGKYLYFTAPRRRGAVNTDRDGDWDTWRATLDGDGDAERVASLANSAEDEIHPSAAFDGFLFFGVRKHGVPNAPSAIYYWSPKLRTTPALMNTAPLVTASNPYVTPDGRVLIVSGRGPATRGVADLYVLVRGGDGRWSAPQSLGTEVNGDDQEFCPQLTPDGKYLFFSRVHFEGARMTGNNIFVVPVRSVPVLREALGGR